MDEVAPASPGLDSTWGCRPDQEKPSNKCSRRNTCAGMDLGLFMGGLVGRLEGPFSGLFGVRFWAQHGRAYHLSAEPQGDFRPPRGASTFSAPKRPAAKIEPTRAPRRRPCFRAPGSQDPCAATTRRAAAGNPEVAARSAHPASARPRSASCLPRAPARRPSGSRADRRAAPPRRPASRDRCARATPARFHRSARSRIRRAYWRNRAAVGQRRPDSHVYSTLLVWPRRRLAAVCERWPRSARSS